MLLRLGPAQQFGFFNRTHFLRIHHIPLLNKMLAGELDRPKIKYAFNLIIYCVYLSLSIYLAAFSLIVSITFLILSIFVFCLLLFLAFQPFYFCSFFFLCIFPYFFLFHFPSQVYFSSDLSVLVSYISLFEKEIVNKPVWNQTSAPFSSLFSLVLCLTPCSMAHRWSWQREVGRFSLTFPIVGQYKAVEWVPGLKPSPGEISWDCL